MIVSCPTLASFSHMTFFWCRRQRLLDTFVLTARRDLVARAYTKTCCWSVSVSYSRIFSRSYL